MELNFSLGVSLRHYRAVSLFLSLLVVLPVLAAKHRAAYVPPQPEAILSLEVVDSQTGAPVVDVDVTTPYGDARTNRAGRVAVSVPLNRPVALSLSRSGYQTFTDTVTITAATERKVQFVSKPTIKVTTAAGPSYDLDNGSLQIGYAEPFLGYRLSSELKACRQGGGEIVLSTTTVKRFIGPSFTSTASGCCTSGTATGIQTELTSGETARVFFLESCAGNKMEISGRDHTTHALVFVPVTDLTEVRIQ